MTSRLKRRSPTAPSSSPCTIRSAERTSPMKRLVLALLVLALGSSAAFAHVGHGATGSFTAGLAHPLGGLDHVAVMIAVGLWAALKGGRALWAWPAAFVSVMLIGGALGMAGVVVPFVEPG